MKTRLSLLAGCALALSSLLVAPIFAQRTEPGPPCSPDRLTYFPETGHNVCDQFLDFFESHGGVEILGYPLTEWLIEDGWLVQYFQRVRMEYHPDNPPEYQVQLGLLGDFLAPPDKKERLRASDRPKSNDPDRRYFPETGHTTGFIFLKFFDEKGGLDNFGYPVTEFLIENGRFVQYFQRALMEWDPNQNGIVLHNLGEVWIDQHAHLPRWTRPATSRALAPEEPVREPPAVTSLAATASVSDAFTGRSGLQRVWVYVFDQNEEPLEGAEVTLMVHYPTGDQSLGMPRTDSKGHTQRDFELDNPTRGRLVIIDVTVDYQGVEAQVQTSFLPWW
jgi:hypothetical protein